MIDQFCPSPQFTKWQNSNFSPDGPPDQGSECTRQFKTWKHSINLIQLPTKPADLHVKMEAERNTLSISGRSEMRKKRSDGLNVFSTHLWSKQVKVPAMTDETTLSANMTDNMVTITADYKKHDINIEHIGTDIPIEKLD